MRKNYCGASYNTLLCVETNAVSNISTNFYVTISRATYYAITLLDVGLLQFVKVRLKLCIQDF